MGPVSMEFNPYAAPKSQVLQANVETAAETARKTHIETEATIKTMGLLFFLSAAMVLLVGIASFGDKPHGDSKPMVTAILLTALGLGQGMTAYGMRTLKSWARIPAILFCGVALLGFPIGTLLGAYTMVKLFSKQGRFVMTEEYRQIITTTPHVKRKTSILVWVLLALLIIALIGIIAAVALK